MNNKEIYDKEIKKILTCIEELKTKIPTQDNINFINNLKEHEPDIIEYGNSMIKRGDKK